MRSWWPATRMVHPCPVRERVDIMDVQQSQTWGATELSFGSVQVASQVTSFLRLLPAGGAG